jgi:PiT family inorganic phosphate transporter
LGWSLGTNDAANAFGTAVAARVVKYRTAIIVIAAMVMLGAILLGHNNINKLSSIATLRLKSALKAFIVFASAAITVFVMSYLKFPVSANQSITGTVIGAGLVNGVKTVNFGVFKRIAIAWISSPTVAGLLTYLIALATKSYFA